MQINRNLLIAKQLVAIAKTLIKASEEIGADEKQEMLNALMDSGASDEPLLEDAINQLVETEGNKNLIRFLLDGVDSRTDLMDELRKQDHIDEASDAEEAAQHLEYTLRNLIKTRERQEAFKEWKRSNRPSRF